MFIIINIFVDILMVEFYKINYKPQTEKHIHHEKKNSCG